MDKQIKIGANVWTIRYVKNEFSVNPYTGECNNYKQEIIIDDGLNKYQKEQTEIHELLHAIGYTMEDTRLQDDEAYVNILSHYLVEIIRQLQRSKIDKYKEDFKGYTSEDIIK